MDVNCLGIITCVLQVRKDLEDPMQLCPPSVLQERENNAICMQVSLFLVKSIWLHRSCFKHLNADHLHSFIKRSFIKNNVVTKNTKAMQDKRGQKL